MFYIYSGYVSPDHYDASEGPIYVIKNVASKEEVADFREEFQEEIRDECSNVIFRVFEGKERQLKAKDVVTRYELD